VADTSDVENALKTLCVAAVYPNGTGAASIVNATVGVERGWPTANDLDAELGAGQAIVSIFPPEGMERNTTRWPREEQLHTAPAHTLSVNVSGNEVTIGGSIAVPQNVIVQCGTQFAFAYGVRPNDTPTTIAAELAALIAEAFPGTSSNGPVVTLAGKPGIVQARIASTGQIYVEQKRQEKTYWITCWCPNPTMRDTLAPAIDVALSELDFISLADGTVGRIRYASSRTSDEGQKVQIYRRDLVYTVEYGTGTITTAPETGAVGVSVNSNAVFANAAAVSGDGELDYSDSDNLVLDTGL
jgi:hypothetical protein